VIVLFVGEGRHDIGEPNPNPYQPRPTRGSIPTLARRVCPAMSADSVALAWTEIRRFNPAALKRGYEAKVPAAVLLASRRFGCAGTVLVTDRDADPDRYAALQAGVARARQLFPGHRIAFGLAVESVEAWTLGAPDEIAVELGVNGARVRAEYPRGVHVEALSERSGKEEHRPKRLLERLTGLAYREDSVEFREAVAERTEVTTLERACPEGFAPFVAELRAAFGEGS
jgi:hypothetical protein